MFKSSTRRNRNGILGTTNQFFPGDTPVRDRSGMVLGRASELFNNIRDGSGCLVSNNTSDARLLFRK